MKGMFGDLARLENLIYNYNASESMTDKAKKIHDRILGNFRLTVSEVKFINKLK